MGLWMLLLQDTTMPGPSLPLTPDSYEGRGAKMSQILGFSKGHCTIFCTMPHFFNTDI